ncbi:hypothetical protein [Streptomyces sp. NPDC086010]|uniref:hypothetical protein n=1 Tax=Streptomyces sp. NPDC086010 TaxID=3365745 RepID=UPI0037D936FD
MTGMDLPRWRERHTAAVAASEELKTALAGLGIPERLYRGIRPATTSTGRPYVYLGIMSAAAVEAITTALQRADAGPNLFGEWATDVATPDTEPVERRMPSRAQKDDA